MQFDRKKILRWVLLLAVPFLALYLLYLVRGTLLPFILAIILTYLLNPMVNMLEKRGMRRLRAIILVYVLLGGMLALGVVFGLPRMVVEIEEFAVKIPSFVQKAQQLVHEFQDKYDGYSLPVSVRIVLDEKIKDAENEAIGLARRSIGGITSLFSYVISFIVAPIFAFYFLKDLDLIKKRWESFLPKQYRTDIMGLTRDVDQIVARFLRGHVMICVIVGVMVGVGLALIGMEFALLLGIITGIAELIPYFGPIIGAVPVVLLALMKSKWMVLYALLVLLIVQQIESSILTPRILGRSVGLHPVWVVFALLAGGELFGVAGLLLAVPAAAILRVLVNFVYLKLVG